MSQSCRGFSFTDTALRCPAFISVHYHKILPYLDETADTSIFLLYLPISAEGPLCTSQDFYLVIYFTGRTKNKEMPGLLLRRSYLLHLRILTASLSKTRTLSSLTLRASSGICISPRTTVNRLVCEQG